ncbi:fungal hydrophobin [Fomitiporia mediterranea MF3/22]|uniref:fungal hydrophobin n=1 Tax=Fomitiporia mediterranea (strain MF3/22) TaxID=694068 RepID=UPI0004408D43|nr:fungal hydrophobin [Fomitiporia mediterranea MF3/22]EJD00330.1 fungal hydrophobin [Fomitiporia mediterranea MF3/22]
MFAFKVATVLAVAAFVSAVPTPGGGSSCSTGKLQCCDSIAPNGGKDDAALGGLLGLDVLQGLNVPIGINCNPLSVVGVGSAGTCSTQAACCNGVTNSGLVPIGLDCSPVNVGL